MVASILFRVAAGILALGTLGHTLGGMIGTARRGPGAGPEADRVLAEMKTVRFTWRGADVTWFGFWMGNGLGVSALLVLAVAVLLALGAVEPGSAGPLLPVAWVAAACLAALAVMGVRYFGARIGAVFGLVAALTGVGALLLSLGSGP
jgi:hypothetical protein